MLTAIGRTAVQRLVLRAVPLAAPRTQPVARAACRAFSTSQWARAPAAKASSSTTTKTKKTAAKKTDGAKTKKVAAAKPKAPKKKKAVKKPVKKKPVKKVLTPEEKQKLNVKEWKKLALLSEPKRLPYTAWNVYASTSTRLSTSIEDMVSRTKEAAESFKTLPSYEIQRLQEQAEKNRLANEAAYKEWVESHTPQAIAEANAARAKLRKANGRQRTPAVIRDERQPKRAGSPYTIYTRDRWATGEFAGQLPTDVAPKITEEWKNLPEAEKAKYVELAKEETDRWERDSLRIMGHVAKRSKTP